ncbi:MAG: PQQ-dependent sugar dehydrogenase, partial [Actinomycetota bacterium]
MAARFVRALAGLLIGGLLAPVSAAALELEPVGDFASPTYVTSDPDDPDRLFVVEQDGRIQLSEGGGTPTPFLDIDDIVRSAGEMPGGNEEGLFSIAFSPGYASDNLFYVYYTNASSNLVIAEFESSGDTTDPATRRQVLEIPHPQGNHNGGQLQLGPDGYLYAATGDGGGGNDPGNNAQDLRSLLGKVLRIDPSGEGEGDYTVPGDNPFAAPAGCGAPPDGCDEIWSYGLRNPWRFSFDRLTGALAIGDVGQAAWEEIDYRPPPDAGRRINFGWDCREGLHEAASASAEHCVQSPVVPFTDPVFEYEQVGGNCSITGGYVVRDPGLGDLFGRYLYADLCAGEVRSLCPAVPLAGGDRSEGIDVQTPTSFGEDAAGRVYVA